MQYVQNLDIWLNNKSPVLFRARNRKPQCDPSAHITHLQNGNHINISIRFSYFIVLFCEPLRSCSSTPRYRDVRTSNLRPRGKSTLKSGRRWRRKTKTDITENPRVNRNVSTSEGPAAIRDADRTSHKLCTIALRIVSRKTRWFFTFRIVRFANSDICIVFRS